MSHFTVCVVVPAEEAAKSLDDYLTQVLDRYDENRAVPRYKQYVEGALEESFEYRYARDRGCTDLTPEGIAKYLNGDEPEDEERYQVDETGLFQWRTYNPDSKWDWWQIGGRWRGYFKPKPEAPGDVGAPGTFDNEPRPGGVDIVRKVDVDWDGMHAEYVAMAEAGWDRFEEGVREQVEKHGVTEVEARLRESFLADVRVVNTRELMLVRNANEQRQKEGGAVEAEPEPVFETKESYVERQSHMSTHALVDKDGTWRESGRMGWFGVSSDDDDPFRSGDWAAEWRSVIDAADDDDILVALDCHI